MFVHQTFGYFSTENGGVCVRHYRYFLAISQQKPRKRNFGEKKFFRALSAQLLASLREMQLDAISLN
jgi:hypothetical protein